MAIRELDPRIELVARGLSRLCNQVGAEQPDLDDAARMAEAIRRILPTGRADFLIEDCTFESLGE